MPHIVPVTNETATEGGDAQAGTEAEPPLSLDIDVVHDGGDWAAIAGADELVRLAAAAVAAELELVASEACVALSNDSQVAELNKSYRGKAAPTNVLSFPAGPSIPIHENEARFLGDVVLALETLQREAGDLGLPVRHHVQHLVVHGVLHLLGYDHGTDEEARAMEGLEVRILRRLGIADPYAAAGEPIHLPEHLSQRTRS
jgi:probable rRNA maturation factor